MRGLDYDVDGFRAANDQREVRIRTQHAIFIDICVGGNAGNAIGIGYRARLLIFEEELCDGRIVDAADIGINGPCIDLVGTLASNEVIIAFATKQPILVAE